MKEVRQGPILELSTPIVAGEALGVAELIGPDFQALEVAVELLCLPNCLIGSGV